MAPLMSGVYPRVCGGTLRIQIFLHGIMGLSPRVRGNQDSALDSTLTDRSIPACAGEPLLHKIASLENTVYPRVCGGTGAGNAGGDYSERSIPACAGEPLSDLYSLIRRGCEGLSPRVRGNHFLGSD